MGPSDPGRRSGPHPSGGDFCMGLRSGCGWVRLAPINSSSDGSSGGVPRTSRLWLPALRSDSWRRFSSSAVGRRFSSRRSWSRRIPGRAHFGPGSRPRIGRGRATSSPRPPAECGPIAEAGPPRNAKSRCRRESSRPLLELDLRGVDHIRDRPIPARDYDELEDLLIAEVLAQRSEELIGDPSVRVELVGEAARLSRAGMQRL
jgi:hypothetical protein